MLRNLPLGGRVIAGLLALAILAFSLVGGCAAEPSAEPTVRGFLLAWEQGRYWDAAGYTTGARNVVANALRGAYRQVGAAALFLTMGKINVHDGHASARFFASVDLGQDGAPWRYEGEMTLSRSGNDWQILWSPAVINPHLRPGFRFAVVTGVPPRAPILDSARHPLIRDSPAYVLGVRPGKLSDPQLTASKLASVAGLGDPNQVLGKILAAPPDSFLELLTLKPSAYRPLSHRLKRISGLQIHRVSLPLSPSAAPGIIGNVGTENAQLLHLEGLPYQPGTTVGRSGLQQVYQHRLAGTPTTEVVVEDSRGHVMSVLQKRQGVAPSAVQTTISYRIQQAASRAVRSVPDATAIVAVQASTGRILAIASHSGNGRAMSAADALVGRYPPGEAFTIVSTAALLASGFSADTQIPCAQTRNVGGETFTNDRPERDLGAEPSFSADFAGGCGTAFAALSRRLSGSQLTTAAGKFGLGSRWQLPLPSFSGSVPVPRDDAQQAAEMIGEGGVTVSPLAMALVAAEVDSGAWHRPLLVTVPPDGGNASVTPFGPPLIGSMRSLMRGTVRSGAAQVADLPGTPVFGQVGAAPIGSGRTWADWFVGFRGDVAFAVLALGKRGTGNAASAGKQFLNAAG